MSSDRTITLIANDGTRLILACNPDVNANYWLRTDPGLWGITPYTVTSRRIGELPGERVERVQAGPRLLPLPILVQGTSETTLDNALAQLGAFFAPPQGDIRILFKTTGRGQRELTATYMSGAEAITVTSWKTRHAKVNIVLKAHYPYWRGPAGDYSKLSGVFNDGRNAGINYETYFNGGDVDCWPEIFITGYAENIEAMNLTTGQVWRFMDILPLNSTLRVDHDRRRFGVWVDNVYAYTGVDPISEFWPLVPGDNHILFRGNTATGAETIGGWTIRFRFQYETP